MALSREETNLLLKLLGSTPKDAPEDALLVSTLTAWVAAEAARSQMRALVRAQEEVLAAAARVIRNMEGIAGESVDGVEEYREALVRLHHVRSLPENPVPSSNPPSGGGEEGR